MIPAAKPSSEKRTCKRSSVKRAERFRIVLGEEKCGQILAAWGILDYSETYMLNCRQSCRYCQEDSSAHLGKLCERTVRIGCGNNNRVKSTMSHISYLKVGLLSWEKQLSNNPSSKCCLTSEKPGILKISGQSGARNNRYMPGAWLRVWMGVNANHSLLPEKSQHPCHGGKVAEGALGC